MAANRSHDVAWTATKSRWGISATSIFDRTIAELRVRFPQGQRSLEAMHLAMTEAAEENTKSLEKSA